jgi:hypothetical protein
MSSWQQRQIAQEMSRWFALWAFLSVMIAFGAGVAATYKHNGQYVVAPWICWIAVVFFALLAPLLFFFSAKEFRNSNY